MTGNKDPPTRESQIESKRVQIEIYKKRCSTHCRDILALSPLLDQVNSDPSIKNFILAKLSTAESSFESYSSIWEKIESLYVSIGESDSFPTEDDYANRNTILDILHRAQAFKLSIEREPSAKSAENSIKDASASQLNDSRLFSYKPSLPNLSLPCFSGDITSWVHFRDTFTSLVHSESSLSSVEKFHYLISSLSGEALSVVTQYTVTDANYALAWKTLLDTYNNNRVIAYSYIEKILDFKINSNKASLYELQGFLSCVADNISAFKALSLSNPEDVILTCLALRTLDSNTRHQFELSQLNKEFPSSDDLIKYIRNGCQALKMTSIQTKPQSCQSKPPRAKDSNKSNHFKYQGRFPNRASLRYNNPSMLVRSNVNENSCSHASGSSNRNSYSPKNSLPKNSFGKSNDKRSSSPASIFKCPFCQNQHSLLRCFVFSELKPTERIAFVSQWKGCQNCLRDNHSTKECSSKLSCRYCGQRHHSLLHTQSQGKDCTSTAAQDETTLITSSATAPKYSSIAFPRDQVLLCTAKVLLKDQRNRYHPVRVLLDSGSTRSFITESCATRLRLDRIREQIKVTGLGQHSNIPVLGYTTCSLHSCYDLSSSVHVQAFIIPKITGQLPLYHIYPEQLSSLKGLQLADSEFGQPSQIDILLGADVYNSIVISAPSPVGNACGSDNGPYATDTIFGAVISGRYPLGQGLRSHSVDTSLVAVSSDELITQLQRFWELEEVSPPTSANGSVVDYCEELFLSTHQRDTQGRYIVQLPRKENFLLGDNRRLAMKRFLNLETKFSKNPELREAYVNFMEEYQKLHHMTPATKPSTYIIPHHAVFKGGKMRVVFDASCPSSTQSLNAQLLPGPALQADISDVLFRFRLHSVAIVADLVKMYRQVLIHPKDRQLQHIYWRSSPDSELVEFELNTVTYGTTPAAFLAMRSIVQLVKDEGHRFPIASKRILTDMFVDDFVSGASSRKEAQSLIQELIQLFRLGGFELGKWSSNHPDILPHDQKSNQSRITLTPEENSAVKVLGLVWDPQLDIYAYELSTPSFTMTKRSVLSTIARIFDPLGLLAPVVFKAKLFLRKLWQLKVDWDDVIPDELQKIWFRFLEHWPILSKISVSRHVPIEHCTEYAIVGFCDASCHGYAAAIYARLRYADQPPTVHLIKAKTKIAPVQFHSIARLELCGAHLLSRLYDSLKLSQLSCQRPRQVYLMTDSTVVLAWLQSSPSMLKTFEANRVSAIRSLSKAATFYHVGSQENPSDLASRGLTPSEIIHNSLWWTGPSWLQEDTSSWPIKMASEISPSFLAQEYSKRSLMYTSQPEWLLKFSKLHFLVRTAARLVRFLSRSSKSALPSPEVSSSEYAEGLQALIRMVQRIEYPLGIADPRLKQLSPFVDQRSLLKVGGRLQQSPLPEAARSPLILPTKSKLTQLIIDDYHLRHFHAGPTLLLCLIRCQFWIPAATRLIKSRIRACINCRRRRAKPLHPMMAPLPANRFCTGRPFIQTGVDFAGPFLIRDSLRRKPAITKAYICLFVCLATKAIHLELVTSLSTEAFLATLDRFISRRGIPKVLHSDNATNFVGTSRYLKDLFGFLVKSSPTISRHLCESGIEWRFIPPRAPHFGGLWEAGIKSVKQLLPSSVGATPLTFEELSTILCRVEALLNSRPLCPLTQDPDCFDPLTPGHFIIGSSMKGLPHEDLSLEADSKLSRWQLVQSRISQVWNRWHKEYLHTLNQRSKWTRRNQSLQVGDLVVLIEGKTCAGLWPLARVIDVHPGSDGVVRVATVRNAAGNGFRRAVSSLSLLPVRPPDS